MKKMNSKKGFTLIELLIVIAIIAVLAVAFLPTLLGAPAKGRDTARIASLQKIQKVLINANLAGKPYPVLSGVIADGLAYANYGGTNTWAELKADFGGTLPADPTTGFKYYFVKAFGSYAFGVWAQVEILTNGNANCNTADFSVTIGTPVAAAAAPATTVPCYAVLTQ
ncbi:MAG: type II secretion system protein [Candidatus Peregrinibacteria bacterium]|nr:type II secretion system protein [Candidatus Peregrinibacteria bacterium]